MKKTGILKPYVNNNGCLRMWLKALDFWGINYEIIDCETFINKGSDSYQTVIISGINDINADTYNSIEKYLEAGGKVIISGEIPVSLTKYFGNIKVKKITRKANHRCIKLRSGHGLSAWNDEEVLFFANTYNCSGKDFEITDTGKIDGDVLAVSQYMSLVNEGKEEWGNWSVSSQPSIIEKKVHRGKIIYIPLPVGEMEWVVQPSIPYFSEYPYILENNAIMIFVKSILEYVTGPGQLQFKPLWPDNARCAVCITGDVHDYAGIKGREDRECMDMLYNFNILNEYGLKGRASYYICGAAVKKHPETIREGLERGYELCPHTYSETQYSVEKWSYNKQKNDVKRCIEEFTQACPTHDEYIKGFRTHGYQSDYTTRQVLEDLGYEYIADLQGWEVSGQFGAEAPKDLVTYAALPQYAANERGKRLRLLEIPDTIANDHYAYRMMKWSPQEALEFWKSEFDKIYRRGGLFQTCLHPYISIKEGRGREAAYRRLLEYMLSHEGVVFLRMDELARWWKRGRI